MHFLPQNQRPQVLLRTKFASADIFLILGYKNLSKSVENFLGPSGLKYRNQSSKIRVKGQKRKILQKLEKKYIVNIN